MRLLAVFALLLVALSVVRVHGEVQLVAVALALAVAATLTRARPT